MSRGRSGNGGGIEIGADAPVADPRQPPRRYPRWILTTAYAVEGLFSRVLPGKWWYARTLRRQLQIAQHQVRIPSLPAPFRDYRIAHLSDFHGGPFLDAASLDPVVAAVNGLDPDLVVLTGDYLTHRAEEGVALAAALGRMRARDGVYCVFGNHDYRERREGEMEAAFKRVGIHALRNRGHAIHRGGAAVWLAGIEDVEEGKVVDLPAALAGREEAGAECTILLAHHPEASGAAAEHRVSLVLSGHTHGGQWVVFGRALLPSARGRYRHGLYRVGEHTQLYVTRGVGVLLAPFRIGAAPEIACLDLTSST